MTIPFNTTDHARHHHFTRYFRYLRIERLALEIGDRQIADMAKTKATYHHTLAKDLQHKLNQAKQIK